MKTNTNETPGDYLRRTLKDKDAMLEVARLATEDQCEAMTQNTIEVEEIAKMIDLYAKFCADNKQGSPELQAEMIMTTIHHQLQKARESCICKDKGVIELLEEQNKEAKSKIASLYLPAHEVSHGEDCIECKEIAAYNAALQDAIKAITVSYHSELDQDNK